MPIRAHPPTSTPMNCVGATSSRRCSNASGNSSRPSAAFCAGSSRRAFSSSRSSSAKATLPRKSSRANNIVMVPFFISDGLHSYEDIPVMLGEPEPEVRDRLNRGQLTWRNPTEKNGKLVWYTRAIGSEPHLADVILERVREAARGEE